MLLAKNMVANEDRRANTIANQGIKEWLREGNVQSGQNAQMVKHDRYERALDEVLSKSRALGWEAASLEEKLSIPPTIGQENSEIRQQILRKYSRGNINNGHTLLRQAKLSLAEDQQP